MKFCLILHMDDGRGLPYAQHVCSHFDPLLGLSSHAVDLERWINDLFELVLTAKVCVLHDGGLAIDVFDAVLRWKKIVFRGPAPKANPIHVEAGSREDLESPADPAKEIEIKHENRVWVSRETDSNSRQSILFR